MCSSDLVTRFAKETNGFSKRIAIAYGPSTSMLLMSRNSEASEFAEPSFAIAVKVNFTSSAVSSAPLWNLTPFRRWNRQVRPPSRTCQEVFPQRLEHDVLGSDVEVGQPALVAEGGDGHGQRAYGRVRTPLRSRVSRRAGAEKDGRDQRDGRERSPHVSAPTSRARYIPSCGTPYAPRSAATRRPSAPRRRSRGRRRSPRREYARRARGPFRRA